MKTVLIVEDDPDIAEGLRYNLEREGLEARVALTGEQGLAAALDAFTHGDADAARAVIARDDEIDEMYERLFHELIRLMAHDPTTTSRAARLLFVGKHLERIGDYVTDICELTVYMAEAAFIKHVRSDE